MEKLWRKAFGGSRTFNRRQTKLPPNPLWEEKHPQTIHNSIPHYVKGYLDKTSSELFKYCHHKVFQLKTQSSPKTEFQIYGNARKPEFSLRVCIAKLLVQKKTVWRQCTPVRFSLSTTGSTFSNRIKCLATRICLNGNSHPMSMSAEALGKNESFRNWIRLKLDF